MQRLSFDDCRLNFLKARQDENWGALIDWSNELIQYHDSLHYVWANRGIALAKLKQPIDAILSYDKALSCNPESFERSALLVNKGAAYYDLYQFEYSQLSLEDSIKLHPHPQAYLTLGNIYKFKGMFETAIEQYRKGMDIDSSYADIHLVLAQALLKSGQLREGWAEFEWRWRTDQLPPRNLPVPLWYGEDLADKHILVYGEQGLGDIIQFSRYANLLKRKYPSAKITMEVRPQLKRLMETLNSSIKVINLGEKLPSDLNYGIAMVSLAGRFTPSIDQIPPASDEFKLDEADVERWKKSFDDAKRPGLRISLCWAGMARDHQPDANAIDRQRSAAFSDFSPLGLEGIFWVSLQKGVPAEQIRKPPRGFMIGDFTEDMYDFYETCCAIKNLDLVITVDTAVVHAAASVGVPTWLLRRWDGCWRWFGDRADSPWYPTLRQFVQKRPQDWTGVMAEVKQELQKLLMDSTR